MHNPHHFKTSDLESEYDGMLVQTDEKFVDHWKDKRHSKYWNDRLYSAAKDLNKDWRQTFTEAAQTESSHNPDHFRTVNFEDEYNGMLLQTGLTEGSEFVDHGNPVKLHSKYWNDRVLDASRRLNSDWRQTFAEAEASESVHNPDHFRTVNFEDEYNGMLLQTGESYTDHWNDRRHSKYWKDRIRDQSYRTNQELLEAYSR